MQIEFIVCPDRIEAKLTSKHNVTCREARHVLFSKPRIRFAEKGHTKGEDVYVAFGQTRSAAGIYQSSSSTSQSTSIFSIIRG